ncbi:uncharacterized protein V6R79_022650 [Siganus canaliculatus]
MATYRPKVISLTKRPGHTFGFYLRIEQGEQGHLVRSLEVGGPAQLAGMKDGDRILRVNGAFIDDHPHSEVVELVRNSGASVTFHVLDEASYVQAKSQGVNLSDFQSTKPAAKRAPKPKLCYLVKSGPSFGFSIRSSGSKQGLFMTEVIPGSVAYKAGIRVNDRLVEINGENTEDYTHSQVVEKIRQLGSSLMILVVDDETDEYYKNKRVTLGSWMATIEHLPLKPRMAEMNRDSDGYGFLLKELPNQTGQYLQEIDSGSPAQRAGLKVMDRVVAVNGKEVDKCSHEQVVDMVRNGGNKCCLVVVDKQTDQMFNLAKVSPMIYFEEMKESNSPPSYTEAINLPARVHPSTPTQGRMEELRPKLCRMEKMANGFGFHLNGIQGVQGQYIKEVVKGGAADRAGLEDDDFVVEVNGVNVEQNSYDEVVDMIRRGGSSLELLVAKKSVYDQLKARGVTITRLLLVETNYAQIHRAPKTSRENNRPDSPAERERESDSDSDHESRPETPAERARESDSDHESRPETPAERARESISDHESRPETPAERARESDSDHESRPETPAERARERDSSSEDEVRPETLASPARERSSSSSSEESFDLRF